LGIHIAFVRAFQEIIEYPDLHIFRLRGMYWRGDQTDEQNKCGSEHFFIYPDFYLP
jgi:hypothetical protein